MKTHFERYKFFLILGILFILGGYNLLVIFLSPLNTCSYLLFPTAILLVGLAILIASITGKRKAFITFVGLLLCSSWVLLLLIVAGIIPYTLRELWPILVIISGIVLVPLGFIRYGFLPISFFVSACVLCALGTLFLLFSLDVIAISITEFASKWWPLIFIFFGMSLIALFFYTKKHEREKWIKNSDDYED